MNSLKKILGLVWLTLAPVLLWFMTSEALKAIEKATTDIARINTTLQWGIILIIFVPVCVGLMIFGYYAFRGEYDHLPENSTEIIE